jgi:dGTPase
LPTVRKRLVHDLIDGQVSDVLVTSGSFLACCGWTDARAAFDSPFRIGPGEPLAGEKAELELFLEQRVYRHPQLVRVRQQAQRRVCRMFDGYQRRPELLPTRFRGRVDTLGLPRSVAEYMAGMTDRFCVQQYKRFFAGPGGD